MAVLYDLALETTALRDLRPLFVKAAEEAGRLIHADHTSVLRFDPADGWLKVFAAWARDSAGERLRLARSSARGRGGGPRGPGPRCPPW